MTAEIVNIPLQSDHLYLLRLEPSDGIALFRYLAEEEGVWLIIECHVANGVTAVEECREVPGGALHIRTLPIEHAITSQLAGQAERITQQQFKVWRGMTARDRVALQVAWAQEELLFTEAQLTRAMVRPFPEGMGRRYDYEALDSHMRLITRAHGELTGLMVALDTLTGGSSDE